MNLPDKIDKVEVWTVYYKDNNEMKHQGMSLKSYNKASKKYDILMKIKDPVDPEIATFISE